MIGTHEFIGSGQYGKDGLWSQWGKPFKAPTHTEVQAFLKAWDRRIAASKSGDGQDDPILTFLKHWGIPSAVVKILTPISGAAGPDIGIPDIGSTPISGITRY